MILEVPEIWMAQTVTLAMTLMFMLLQGSKSVGLWAADDPQMVDEDVVGLYPFNGGFYLVDIAISYITILSYVRRLIWVKEYHKLRQLET